MAGAPGAPARSPSTTSEAPPIRAAIAAGEALPASPTFAYVPPGPAIQNSGARSGSSSSDLRNAEKSKLGAPCTTTTRALSASTSRAKIRWLLSGVSSPGTAAISTS